MASSSASRPRARPVQQPSRRVSGSPSHSAPSAASASAPASSSGSPRCAASTAGSAQPRSSPRGPRGTRPRRARRRARPAARAARAARAASSRRRASACSPSWVSTRAQPIVELEAAAPARAPRAAPCAPRRRPAPPAPSACAPAGRRALAARGRAPAAAPRRTSAPPPRATPGRRPRRPRAAPRSPSASPACAGAHDVVGARRGPAPRRSSAAAARSCAPSRQPGGAGVVDRAAHERVPERRTAAGACGTRSGPAAAAGARTVRRPLAYGARSRRLPAGGRGRRRPGVERRGAAAVRPATPPRARGRTARRRPPRPRSARAAPAPARRPRARPRRRASAAARRRRGRRRARARAGRAGCRGPRATTRSRTSGSATPATQRERVVVGRAARASSCSQPGRAARGVQQPRGGGRPGRAAITSSAGDRDGPAQQVQHELEEASSAQCRSSSSIASGARGRLLEPRRDRAVAQEALRDRHLAGRARDARRARRRSARTARRARAPSRAPRAPAARPRARARRSPRAGRSCRAPPRPSARARGPMPRLTSPIARTAAASCAVAPQQLHARPDGTRAPRIPGRGIGGGFPCDDRPWGERPTGHERHEVPPAGLPAGHRLRRARRCLALTPSAHAQSTATVKLEPTGLDPALRSSPRPRRRDRPSSSTTRRLQQRCHASRRSPRACSGSRGSASTSACGCPDTLSSGRARRMSCWAAATARARQWRQVSDAGRGRRLHQRRDGPSPVAAALPHHVRQTELLALDPARPAPSACRCCAGTFDVL